MGMSFHKEGECRSISAKPTSIEEGKDIPKLPENYKKLHQCLDFSIAILKKILQ